ncbi:MAG: 3-deoxy-D-manno-octulosonic acid transferase [Candidatus Omnitrophica bacterium]|nr:3-deoxy-D-manno-octulosonic acid transferase [Candidatus Omnitrophota bacterium]
MNRAEGMMFLLYDVIFIVFMIFYLPIFFVKLQQAENKKRLLLDRFGFFSTQFKEKVSQKKIIWIHAVSVGEVLAAQNFLQQLSNAVSGYQIVFSTVTPTGNRIAKKIIENKAEVFYLPLDVSWITNRVVRFLKPQLIILMETELWPNLILSAKKYGAKVAIVNGRVSPKSFRSYYRVKRLLRLVFRKIDLCLMQTERYAKRLKRIGVPDNKIRVTGNMKFDNVTVKPDTGEHSEKEKVRRGFQRQDKILIAASTHRGEEVFLCDMYRRLKQSYPELKLLIVPRHIERVNEILGIFNNADLSFNVADTSAISPELVNKKKDTNFDVYLLNTIGELRTIYSIGDIVFMGGSLIKHGGQNPLEAIVFKKPIVTGKHIFNFADIYETLFELDAIIKVSSPDKYVQAIEGLLGDQKRTQAMADRAYAWLQEMKGASTRNSNHIIQMLSVMQKGNS